VAGVCVLIVLVLKGSLPWLVLVAAVLYLSTLLLRPSRRLREWVDVQSILALAESSVRVEAIKRSRPVSEYLDALHLVWPDVLIDPFPPVGQPEAAPRYAPPWRQMATAEGAPRYAPPWRQMATAMTLALIEAGFLFQFNDHKWLRLITSLVVIPLAISLLFRTVRLMVAPQPYAEFLRGVSPSIPRSDVFRYAFRALVAAYKRWIAFVITMAAVTFAAAVGAYLLAVATIYSVESQRSQHTVSPCFHPPFAHHVDAFYFTLSTFTTAGFGDIHANNPTCRWLVSGQMVLDITVVALAVAAFVSAYSLRPAPGPPRFPSSQQ